MRHNGYCWEQFRDTERRKKRLRNARKSYFKARMAQLSEMGYNYGYCVWHVTWECVGLYGSCADEY